MGTQVVRHTSRGVDITLNFASTENNLSWSFEQEGDGEIYKVVLNNVSDYAIAGGAITLPYLVVNGLYYTVTIIKTITGQTASITFKTRRSINKQVSLNVLSDYGSASKLYLIHPDSITILDNADIINSTQTNIALPSLPTNHVWRRAVWLTNNKLLVVGYSEAITRSLYACYVNLIDNTVTSITGTANEYTTIISYNGSPGYTYETFSYDFINNIVYIKGTAYIAYVNINTNSFGTIDNNIYTTQNSQNVSNDAYFDPIKGKFVGLCYYSFDSLNTDTIAYFNNATSSCFFDKSRGYKMKKDNNDEGRIFFFNRNGGLISGDSTNISAGNLVGYSFNETLKHIIVSNYYTSGTTNYVLNFKLYDAINMSSKIIKLYSGLDSGVIRANYNRFFIYYSGIGTINYLLFYDVNMVNNGVILLIDSSKNATGDTTPIVGTFASAKPIMGITSNRIL